VQSSSQNVTTDKPTPIFLQAGYPSHHPTNNVKALKGNPMQVHIMPEKSQRQSKSRTEIFTVFTVAEITFKYVLTVYTVIISKKQLHMHTHWSKVRTLHILTCI